MGSRAVIRGNRHFGRQINYQITSYFHPREEKIKVHGQSHLICMNFGKFLPLSARELSNSVEEKTQTKTRDDNKEKEQAVAQANEKVKKKYLQIDPSKSSEYTNRKKLGIDFQHWKGNFMSAVRHYWHGTKLLWVDTKISSKLLFKLINGKELSRREKRQLARTSSDIVKLVPFAVFVIVPFMEFLIPVLLKVFPNMIPSTFKGEMQNDDKLKRNLKERMEYTKFLQETIRGMEKEIKGTHSEIKKTAEDLDEFMSKVRTGDNIPDQEILLFAKLFDDELLLENLNRSKLLSMCNMMGILFVKSDYDMRTLLAGILTRIKNDDLLIWQKGIQSLSDCELEQACKLRGDLDLFSEKQMYHKLHDWLDFSLNHAVPISLLVLSRPFAVSDEVKSIDALRGAISSLPDSVVSTVGAALPSVSERRRKLEFLEMQEELIKEEERERTLAAQKAEEHVRTKSEHKQEGLCKISRALSLLTSASSVNREREELLTLIYKEIELYNLMLDKKGSAGSAHEAKKAYEEARDTLGYKLSELIEKLDCILEELGKELEDVDTIGRQEQLFDKDRDDNVTPEELAAASIYLKENFSKGGVQDIIANLPKDKDGKILVEDIVKLGTKEHHDPQLLRQKMNEFFATND